jgi:hypothetical protein
MFTNSSLTTAYSGLYQLTHQTNFSDNPQTGVLYFGSPSVATRYLRTVTSPGTNQIILTPTDIEQVWMTATSYSVGAIIEPTTSNGYIYICTVAGTSAAVTQPTWPTTLNSTVTDGTGTLVWTCYATKHATTEIRLALAGGSTLSGATPGAALNLGTVIQSGSANCVPVYWSVTNAVSIVNSNVGFPQLGVNINNVQETST